MRTIEEMIAHCDEVGCFLRDEHGREHLQFAEWLKELIWRRGEYYGKDLESQATEHLKALYAIKKQMDIDSDKEHNDISCRVFDTTVWDDVTITFKVERKKQRKRIDLSDLY